MATGGDDNAICPPSLSVTHESATLKLGTPQIFNLATAHASSVTGMAHAVFGAFTLRCTVSCLAVATPFLRWSLELDVAIANIATHP